MEVPSALSAAISILLAWCLWKLVWAFKRLMEHHAIGASSIPTCPKNHWFWGLAFVVKSADDMMQLFLEYVDKTGVRWFRAWVLFLYPVIIVCHPSTMQAVLTAKNVPKSHSLAGPYRMLAPWLGYGLLTSNGKKWERNRRLLTPAFHFDILKPYVKLMNHVSDLFLEKVQLMSHSGESIEIYQMVSRATLHSMLKCTLSYDDDTVQDTQKPHPFVAAVKKLLKLSIERMMNPLRYPDFLYHLTSDYKEYKATCDYAHEFSANIIKVRRQSIEADPSQLNKRHLDFLDILITAKDENGIGLTEQEIQDEVDTFLFEGHDTTSSAISWAINSLALYPGMQEKVRAEVEQVLDGKQHLEADDLSKLTYTTCFIKESMRMYTPVLGIARRLEEPLEVEGVTLPAGQHIEIHPYLLHHNPAVWENHQEFRTERFMPDNIIKKDPYAFLPFAAGQRNCIGQHFAMNEMKIMLASVVTRYNVSLDEERKPVPYAEIILRAKDGMFLYFKER